MANRYRYPNFWDAENKPEDAVREIAARYVDPHSGDMPRQIVAVPSTRVIVVASPEAASTNVTASYTKLKDIDITYPGSYTFLWEMHISYANSTVKAIIYKNGAVFGGVVSTMSMGPEHQQTTLGPWVRGDKAQLYVQHGNVNGNSVISNFQIWGELGLAPGYIPAGAINLA